MKSTPSTPARCRLLVRQWRKELDLSNFEKKQFAGELKILDRHIERLVNKHLRIVVFGRVGVGKSSLLNALIGKELFATDVAHGCTRRTAAVNWEEQSTHLDTIELVDSPGVDEIAAEARAKLASRIALQGDLVLLVVDSDITSVELQALNVLLRSGKPILIILNRSDQWESGELNNLIKSIRNRLPSNAKNLEIIVTAAAPRSPQIQSNGLVRSHRSFPKIESLRTSLKKLIETDGELLLSLNTLRQADSLCDSINNFRLQRNKLAAQGLIGKYAAIKASGVAANPVLMLDLAGGFACDTALILQLSKLYGLQMGGSSARQLLKSLSLYNGFLGGAQLGIQMTLGILKHLMILATPITGGLSLATSAPIAMTQAALAVYTTKLTGRLVAFLLLKDSKYAGGKPSAMLCRLAMSDPAVQHWLNNWPINKRQEAKKLQAFLP